MRRLLILAAVVLSLSLVASKASACCGHKHPMKSILSGLFHRHHHGQCSSCSGGTCSVPQAASAPLAPPVASPSAPPAAPAAAPATTGK